MSCFKTLDSGLNIPYCCNYIVVDTMIRQTGQGNHFSVLQ